MAGKRFALVYAPAFRDDTFIHLNVEGTHWKLRWYPSAHEQPVVLAQSAPSSKPEVSDLRAIERLHEIAYPHSSASKGVGVKDSRYWFDAIARTNAQHAEAIRSSRREPSKPRSATANDTGR